jgi:hypothetical protein
MSLFPAETIEWLPNNVDAYQIFFLSNGLNIGWEPVSLQHGVVNCAFWTWNCVLHED